MKKPKKKIQVKKSLAPPNYEVEVEKQPTDLIRVTEGNPIIFKDKKTRILYSVEFDRMKGVNYLKKLEAY